MGSSVDIETVSGTDSEACKASTEASDDSVSYPGVGVALGLCMSCLAPLLNGQVLASVMDH